MPQTDLMPGANVKVLAIVTQPDGSKRAQTAVGWMTNISKAGRAKLTRVCARALSITVAGAAEGVRVFDARVDYTLDYTVPGISSTHPQKSADGRPWT